MGAIRRKPVLLTVFVFESGIGTAVNASRVLTIFFFNNLLRQSILTIAFP